MEHFFNPDNPVSRVLTHIFDLIVLNACFILTSIPLFSIGAGLTGLYSALLWREREDSYAVKIYFSSFRANFKKATIIWLIFGTAAGFLSYELYLIYNVLDKGWRFLQFPVWISLFLVTSVLLYSFPQVAHFEQSIIQTLKNAMRISIGSLPVTVLMLVLLFVLADLSLHNGTAAVVIFSIFLFLGFALLIKLFCFYLKGIFKNISEK